MQPLRPTDVPLSERADFIKENGQLIEVQDYYSFNIHVYLVGRLYMNLLYDFSGSLVSVEPAVGQQIISYLNANATQPNT